jgi:hypothetical protein
MCDSQGVWIADSLWAATFTLKMNSSTVIGDIISDSTGLEIAIVSADALTDSVYVLTSEGQKVWSRGIGYHEEGYYCSPILVDTDNDNDLELYVGGANYVYAFEGNGDSLSSWPVFIEEGANIVSLSAARTDADSLIIFAVALNGDIYALDEDGEILSGFPISNGEQARGTVTIADLNNNGKIDFGLGRHNHYLHFWTLPYDYVPRQEGLEWTQHRHDLWNKGTVYLTTVQDTLFANMTWRGRVIVTGDVLVLDTVCLTICPGTEVKFDISDANNLGVDSNRCELIVEGQIEVAGQTGKEIVFASNSDSPAAADWYGIRLLDGSIGTLTNMELRHAYQGIRADNADSVEISHSEIESCFVWAIQADTGWISVSDCDIDVDSVGGIYVLNCDGIVEQTKIQVDRYACYGIKVEGTLLGGFDEFEIKHDSILAHIPAPPYLGSYCVYLTDVYANHMLIDSNYIEVRDCGAKSQWSKSNIFGNTFEAYHWLATGLSFYRICSADVSWNHFKHLGYCIQVDDRSYPDIGTTPYNGNNSFDTTSMWFIRQESGARDSVKAEINWWGEENPDASKFVGKIDYDPYLDAPPGAEGKQVQEELAVVPRVFSLSVVAPNPFVGQASIKYQVPRISEVKITLYDATGRAVRQLVDERTQPGSYSVTWHADDDAGRKLGQGIYFCRMKAGDFIRTRKLLLLKGGIQ